MKTLKALSPDKTEPLLMDPASMIEYSTTSP